MISYIVLIGCLYFFGLTKLVEKAFSQRHTTKHLMGSGCNEIEEQFLRFKKKTFPRNQRPMLEKTKQNKKQPQPIKDRILQEKQKPYLILTTHSSFSRLL